jgi:hypothetical protein
MILMIGIDILKLFIEIICNFGLLFIQYLLLNDFLTPKIP